MLQWTWMDFVFDPMVKYVQSFLKTIAEKIAELDKEELPGWKPNELGEKDDLTEKWWKDEKRDAITNLMKDSSTGIGKAIAVLVKEKINTENPRRRQPI